MKRKCNQCRDKYESRDMWPTRNGLLCSDCKRNHSAIENAAGLGRKRR